jgi:signal transduction histidine kinase
VDRYFFREKEAVRRSVATLARELAQSEQLPELGRRLTEQLLQLTRCRYAALLAPLSKETLFEVVGSAGGAEGVRGVTLERDDLAALAGVAEEPVDRWSVASAAGRTLAGAGVSLLLPLRISQSLVGVVLLGPRHYGDAYRKLERWTLASLAAPAALALRNALLLRAHAARERLATLGQLAAVIIHEIKNPLGIIKVSSGTLRKRFADGDTSHDLASFIETEVDRMNRAIAQFLAFARPQPPLPGRVDLGELVQRSLRVIRDDLAGQGVSVVEELAPAVLVRADPDQLQQVLLNLLTNAREALAGRERGRVEVSVRALGERRVAELVVRNDGPAIPAAVRARIFEPFVTTRPGGTGLGLAIAKQVLQEQGGRIVASSEEGQTAFTVTLPLWE